MREGRAIMVEWHEKSYEGVRRTLKTLTPLRNGVPFETVYTEV